MARDRMTRRSRNATEEILASIDALERQMEVLGYITLEAESKSSEDEEKQEDVKTPTAGIDEELTTWADGIAKEERAIAQHSTGENTDAAIGGQTGKMGDNWPTSASETPETVEATEASEVSELSREERVALATELTMLSKGMVKKIANGGLTQEDRQFVARRLLKAAKQFGKV